MVMNMKTSTTNPTLGKLFLQVLWIVHSKMLAFDWDHSLVVSSFWNPFRGISSSLLPDVLAFGLLTTNNEKEAQERAGGVRGNKGGDAALVALEMAALLKKVK